MQHVFVRTKLHSIIARKLLDDGVISRPFHLIHMAYDVEPDTGPYISGLADHAGRVTILRRPKYGFTRLFAYFFRLLARCRFGKDEIFIANVNWHHFGLALKLMPGARLNSFDDGTANLQKNSMFFTDEIVKMDSMAAPIARFLFPGGVARFVRSRIDRHYSIYPGRDNIVDASKIIAVKMDWEAMIEPGDVGLLPPVVRKILVGTVYKEAAQIWKVDITEEHIRSAIAWADLYLPHPRQEHATVDGGLAKYAAEVLISHYAGKGKVIVAHFNSSAAVPFMSDSRVRLVDLSKQENLPDPDLEPD